MKLNVNVDYGRTTIQIEKCLAEKGISKNRICSDLDIPRTNFNRYCRGEFQRLDEGLISKLCWYLDVNPGDLLVYERPENPGVPHPLKDSEQ